MTGEYLLVTPGQVRDYLTLNATASESRYSDDTIGSNIRAAVSKLERETHRILADRPGFTYTTTSMIRAQVPIPGFRAFTSVTWGGSVLTVGYSSQDSASVWAIPDEIMSGTYVALQFRAWRADSDAPWWLADQQWFDKLLDSPFYPGNRGGGFAWTSMPDDLVVVGDAGYAPGTEPEQLLHAVKVLAGFYTMRPASILADVAITPSGSARYTMLPPEVVDFIADFKIGQQVVSV